MRVVVYIKLIFGIKAFATNITVNALRHLMGMLLPKMPVQLSQLAE
jgi:hypothetical protein